MRIPLAAHPTVKAAPVRHGMTALQIMEALAGWVAAECPRQKPPRPPDMPTVISRTRAGFNIPKPYVPPLED
jgi:hypothetical protein